jgi:hypothetical protein
MKPMKAGWVEAPCSILVEGTSVLKVASLKRDEGTTSFRGTLHKPGHPPRPFTLTLGHETYVRLWK